MREARRSNRAAALGLTLALALVAPGAGRASSRASVPHAAPAGTFVSLVPACGCARRTDLDVFSTRTGRRVRTLASWATAFPAQLGTPAADHRGQLFMTLTSSARCAVTGYMECPHWVPDSCTNVVETFVAGHARLDPVLRLPGSEQLGSVAPSPEGSELAMTLAPCLALRGPTGLFIDDRASGAVRPLLTTQNPCDGFGLPAWNPARTRLAFVLDRARGLPTPIAGGDTCPVATNRLAIVGSAGGGLTLIAPDHGCAFAGVAFDRGGLAAAEGCRQGSPPGMSDTGSGDAYLLALDGRGRVRGRFALKRGLEQALVAAVPGTGDVLVTQDQPANQGPEFDWVWRFNGRTLAPIAHYRANDAAQVLAVPW